MVMHDAAFDLEKVLKVFHIQELYPPQKEALPYVFSGKNVVLAVPTAAGKTLVAYLGILHRLRSNGGKALYIVPLRAIAREKYEELLVLKEFGLRIGITTGELDESDKRIFRYDIIICTSEKADSLLRHGNAWVKQVSIVVVDEIHLIHDPTRGPTLEVIIARFRALNPNTQLIALSATIQNAVELTDWLDAQLVQSSWRPVPLKEGVFYRKHIRFNDGSKHEVVGSQKKALELLVAEGLQNSGQSLVFVNSRRSTVSVANRLAMVVGEQLSKDEAKQLAAIADRLQRNVFDMTSVLSTLPQCIASGVAFHNAGLSSFQRHLVESEFKAGHIKCIVATPTLAAGVNIPARRVIIRDLWRYDINFGMTPIPILEYKQQAGRAGRPRFDTVGEAITIAKDSAQQDQIFFNYVLADTEPIFSKLGNQAALRMHLLAAIATDFVNSRESIDRFINSTFYAYQSDEVSRQQEIETALTFLVDNDFVTQEADLYQPTLLGGRTSSLYIDPLSALVLKKALESSCSREPEPVSFLHAVCSTPDIRSLYLRNSDNWVEGEAERHQGVLFIQPPVGSREDYEWYLSDLKTAFLLNDWIEERPLDWLVSKYNIWPGDIHNLVEVAEWLLHAAREFTRMYNFSRVSDVNNLIIRVHHGCKAELLDLVKLKGIGRVRARALYIEGFTTVNSLRGVPVERIAHIKGIGKIVAETIKQQLNEGYSPKETELEEFS
ncbi:MAG: DEAD/DEAH box helicase [Candidatus Thermoplasmatota archaeon]|nr:DEAD/DEAH box helicase [Candidatus Thermoplasmatota archaeon]MBU1941822.1 DEAD/DEAH box helicase [Candidatus Thermoplasmatota archaeon]